MHIACLFLMGGGSGYLHSIIAPFPEAIWCLGCIILWSGRVNKSKKKQKNGAQKFPESRQLFWGGLFCRQTAPYLKPTLGDISPPAKVLPTPRTVDKIRQKNPRLSTTADWQRRPPFFTPSPLNSLPWFQPVDAQQTQTPSLPSRSLPPPSKKKEREKDAGHGVQLCDIYAKIASQRERKRAFAQNSICTVCPDQWQTKGTHFVSVTGNPGGYCRTADVRMIGEKLRLSPYCCCYLLPPSTTTTTTSLSLSLPPSVRAVSLHNWWLSAECKGVSASAFQRKKKKILKVI